MCGIVGAISGTIIPHDVDSESQHHFLQHSHEFHPYREVQHVHVERRSICVYGVTMTQTRSQHRDDPIYRKYPSLYNHTSSLKTKAEIIPHYTCGRDLYGVISYDRYPVVIYSFTTDICWNYRPTMLRYDTFGDIALEDHLHTLETLCLDPDTLVSLAQDPLSGIFTSFQNATVFYRRARILFHNTTTLSRSWQQRHPQYSLFDRNFL